MSTLGWHVTMRMVDDVVLASSRSGFRRVSRSVWERATSDGVLAFRLADNHLHLITLAERPVAGRLAHDVEVSLRWRRPLPPRFDRARIRPIRDRGHLRSAFAYVVLQAERHEVRDDPLHEAGNLQDLLGLRVTGAGSATLVRRALPDVDRDELVRLFLRGLPGVPKEAFDPDAPLAETQLRHLGDASASAICRPSPGGRDPVSVAARVAAVHVGRAWASSGAVGSALGLHRSAVFKLGRRTADARLMTAIRRQLQLRAYLPAQLMGVNDPTGKR